MSVKIVVPARVNKLPRNYIKNIEKELSKLGDKYNSKLQNVIKEEYPQGITNPNALFENPKINGVAELGNVKTANVYGRYLNKYITAEDIFQSNPHMRPPLRKQNSEPKTLISRIASKLGFN